MLNLGWIQQSAHTIFQTNASAGDKAWAAVSLVGAVGLDALQFVPVAGWVAKGVEVVRLAKGVDAAITAASDAEKLVTAASDAEKTITAADEAVSAAKQGVTDLAGVCSGARLSFSADTLVATPSGERAIGTLKVGDQVTAYDPTTGKSSTQTVQHL